MQQQYDPKKSEPKWRRFWEKEKIFSFNPKSKKPIYSIDTPPPYVSADHLHVGHAMSYSQAEFIARFKRMRGFEVFYPMGFDDNGLPTERFVEKKHKINKKKISRKEFVKLCLKETEIGGKTYRRLWTSLGISVDWDLLYSTINPLCQRVSQRSFIDLYKKGHLVRKKEPVIWCPRCETAVAQADLDDEEKSATLNYIPFKVDNKEVLIATTRPELLAACVALFVNPLDRVNKKLVGKKAIVPIFEHEVPVLEDATVDVSFGTGVMMVCTWGDKDDIVKWKKHKLATRLIFKKDGMLNELAGKYKGKNIREVRSEILHDLKEKKLLKKQEQVSHTLNVHERCSTPVEFYQTKQWFIKLLDHKKIWHEQGEKLKWYPASMKSIYDQWIDGLQWDWNISRDRYFGVPFPVWYCKKCSEVILPKDEDLPVDPSQDPAPVKICPKCSSKEIIGERDVMDTWMTSSTTPLINAKWGEKENLMKKVYPLSMRPQAFEIIRTWLFYTVVKSHFHTQSLPWNDVMIAGHGLDAKGEKMSKSKGNVVLPEDMIEKYSADALRFWAASANLGSNLPFQEKDVVTGQKFVTKIWNASKFSLSSMEKFRKSLILCGFDKWVLIRLNKLIDTNTSYFESYEYGRAKVDTENFFWHTFCDDYLEIVKDRMYNPDKRGKKETNSAKQTLYFVLLDSLKMIAPVMPYITEEIYQSYFKTKEKKESIHLSSWPAEREVDASYEKKGDIAISIIHEVRKFKAKQKVSMKAPIVLVLEKKFEKELEEFLDDLKAVCSADSVEFGGEFRVSLKV